MGGEVVELELVSPEEARGWNYAQAAKPPNHLCVAFERERERARCAHYG